MRTRYQHAFSVILAGSLLIICQQSGRAQAESVWRKLNSEAIAAMRSDKFDEAEKLFTKALNQTKLVEDKKSVAGNLALLLHKLGRDNEARKIEEENGLSQASERQATVISGKSTVACTSKPLKGSVQSSEINALIKSLQEQIEKADSTGQLDLLQSLFQKKAEAIKARDHCQSLEYAFTLHYRAQVLMHMKRDAEANALETQARSIRDAIRNIQDFSAEVKAPEIRPSSIGSLNFGFEHTNQWAEKKKEMDSKQQFEAESNELKRMNERQQQNSTSGHMNRYNNTFGK